MTPFAAVLLAGGQSRRMGRDKALLALPDGRLLWERQLEVLRGLEPAELFISGARREGIPLDVLCLPDEKLGRGPLGGIAAALRVMENPRLVVLAIDLPMMTTDFLRKLLLLGDELHAGIVPRHPDGGFYEPLAAVYPQECGRAAATQLGGDDWSLQSFVRDAGALVRPYEIVSSEAPLFTNWNEPTDPHREIESHSPASLTRAQ